MKAQKQQETGILLSWTNHVLGGSISQLIQLWNGEVFHRILSLIPNLSLRPYKPNPCNMWQLSFTNSKTIYRSIQLYWTKTLKKSWQSHAYIDLLKLSKQKNEQQILQMLILVFGCCIQCQDKDRFLQPIYSFNQIEHGEFMSLLHKYKFQDRLIDNKVIQIRDMMTKIEVLEIENDNLEKAMNDQLVDLQLLQESISYLSEENKKMKEQLKGSITVKTQNYMESSVEEGSLDTSITYGEMAMSSQSHKSPGESQRVIGDLKAKAHDDKQNYMREIGQLKETIQFLKETISGNRRDRGVSSRRLSKGITQRIETDHPPCVSLVKYQQVVFAQTQKLKQIAKKEQQKNLHIQKLSKELMEVKEEKQRLVDQRDKVKEVKQVQPVSVLAETGRERGESLVDYESLRINILQGIKNNLEMYSKKKSPTLHTYYIR